MMALKCNIVYDNILPHKDNSAGSGLNHVTMDCSKMLACIWLCFFNHIVVTDLNQVVRLTCRLIVIHVLLISTSLVWDQKGLFQ